LFTINLLKVLNFGHFLLCLDQAPATAVQNYKSKQQTERKEICTVADAQQVMRGLEEAIAMGNHRLAAQLAKEMSKLHITAKLTTQEMSQKQKKLSNADKTTVKPLDIETLRFEHLGLFSKKRDCNEKNFSLQMYVEDEESYRGPYSINVQPSMTLAELKHQVECHFKIPSKVKDSFFL